MTVPPYRVTSEDLSELDKKTRTGLQPLLDALNVTVQQLVQAANTQPGERIAGATFTSDSTGEASVDINPLPVTEPTEVRVAQLYRVDLTPISSVWAFSWTRVASGNVRVLFVGLDVDAQYTLRVKIS